MNPFSHASASTARPFISLSARPLEHTTLRKRGVQEPIRVDEYRKRLADLCARGGRHPLPRRGRDRGILLHALSRRFEGAGPLDERETTARIAAWLQGTGSALETDPVSLRRALVDEGFLDRPPGGGAYRVSSAYEARMGFDRAVLSLDPDLTVEEARFAAAERRKRHRP